MQQWKHTSCPLITKAYHRTPWCHFRHRLLNSPGKPWDLPDTRQKALQSSAGPGWCVALGSTLMVTQTPMGEGPATAPPPQWLPAGRARSSLLMGWAVAAALWAPLQLLHCTGTNSLCVRAQPEPGAFHSLGHSCWARGLPALPWLQECPGEPGEPSPFVCHHCASGSSGLEQECQETLIHWHTPTGDCPPSALPLHSIMPGQRGSAQDYQSLSQSLALPSLTHCMNNQATRGYF